MFRGFNIIALSAPLLVCGACGAPLEGASTSGGSSSASSRASASASATPPPVSPLPSESTADPMCGQGWKWNGVHCVASAFGSGDVAPTSPTSTSSSEKSKEPADSGAHVTIEEIKVGSGAEAKDSSHVRIHYVGKLMDGTTFDSSRDRNSPFSFTIGIGEVIRGFDQGVTGMKVGGMRRVTIPPSLGYGRRGAPPKIPANATLVFEIELLGVE